MSKKHERWIVKNAAIIIIVSIVLIMMISIVISCYSRSIAPKEGTIVTKEYVPGYEYTTHETIYINGEHTRIPVTKYNEPQYRITIYGINKKGDNAKYTFLVPEKEYETLKIGDYYIREK